MNINAHSVEDRYIAYLAGQQNGKSIVGFMDKYRAFWAQQHPIYNTISSLFTGTIRGSALTTFSLLAYPLLDSNIRDSILGSPSSVCWACTGHAKAITDLSSNLTRIIDPKNAPSGLRQFFGSIVDGFGAATKCVTDSTSEGNCRLLNYFGSIIDVVMNNTPLVTATTAAIVAWFVYSSMSAYAAQERQTEKRLENILKDRFTRIANRLGETNLDKGVAKKILDRQRAINKEIESLNLPNLILRDIEEITKPVFKAAKEKQKS